MDEESWNKFCKVFKLNVEVEVKKRVTRSDIIMTLVNEGEFVWKDDKGGWTSMNLSHLKGKATKEQMKTFREILWKQIEDYLTKPVRETGDKG
ncbi:hypothetical protein LCGC14_0632530 [marine sediment metagenome]|uniref:Uncharacterized protein n=1 Tax=marine sediment metagenome TaxID=412755 RepID=A0A0F9U9Y6_9ZZZZ